LRLSELRGKEIINLVNGSKMGVFIEPEAELDIETGVIRSLLLPSRGVIIKRSETIIPWEAIKRISSELVLVEQESTNNGQ
jgi:YlmC/YmxH family sporulation protein